MKRCIDALAGALTTKNDQELAASLRQKLDEWKTLHAQIVELGDSGRVADPRSPRENAPPRCPESE